MTNTPCFHGWKIVRRIGSGHFGAVYEIEKESSKSFSTDMENSAMKVISVPPSEEELESLQSEYGDDETVTTLLRSQVEDMAEEFKLMSKLKGHSNIVSYQDHEIVQQDNGMGWYVLIRMELLTSLSAYSKGRTLEESEVVQLGIDICKALERCEMHNILHRDIKPQNIFVNADGDFKLGDFGVARVSEHMTASTVAGTYTYMAPEVYQNKENYDKRADIYSLGLVLYWLLNERRDPFLPLPPATFTNKEKDAAFQKRMNGEPLPKPARGSPALQAVVLKACAFAREDRFANAAEMRKALELLSKGEEKSTVEEKPAETEEPRVRIYISAEEDSSDDETVDGRGKVSGKVSEQPNFPAAGDDEETISAFHRPADSAHNSAKPETEKKSNGSGSEGFSGFGDLGSIFNEFFGGGSNRKGSHRDEDIMTRLELTFEEAAFGCDKEIPIQRIEICPSCHGNVNRDKAIGSLCNTCRGKGKVRRTTHIKIKIPAGVDSGQSVRVRGEGNISANGSANGDLYVRINIRPHPLFRRDGYDVLCEVPISSAQAAKGATIQVPTIDGAVDFNIPKGTRSGNEFVLQNKGIPKLNNPGCRGNQRFTVIVGTVKQGNNANERSEKRADAPGKANAISKIIGIDLGTTYSRVAVLIGGKPIVIANAEGTCTTPSVVAFSKTGERMVGQVAKRQAVTNAERTVASIKRHMGENYHVTIDGKGYTPQEISAMILQKLKADAESYLGQTVTEAVITVPAYFSDAQRQATKDAGKIAGLDVKRIINEPSAVALTYCRSHGISKENGQKVLIYTLGGGTTNVSVVDISDDIVEVLATAGDTHLGGDDFDARIMDYLVSEFKKAEGINLSGDKVAMQRLKEAAEKAKIELSGVTSTNINLPYITADATGPKHLDVTLTRAKFNKLTADLVERTMKPVRQAMSDAKLKTSDLTKVLLVGGSSRIHAVQDAVKKVTGKVGFKGINPDECVVAGAAIQGGVLTGDVHDPLLLDVTPLSLGIETVGGVFTRLIDRNTTIPTQKRQIFSTVADNQTSVEVHVLQGESEKAVQNKTLGRFQLTGIVPAPHGVPQIEVTFKIDYDGIIKVSAKDLGTGKEQQVSITASTNMSKDELSRAVREAEKYKQEYAARAAEKKDELPPNVYDGKKSTPKPSQTVQSERNASKSGPLYSGNDAHRQLSEEFDNFRRRAAREKDLSYNSGKVDAVAKLLPIYDNLERALRQPSEDTAFKKGVEMTMADLVKDLTGMGVTIFGEPGDIFDPTLHNAVTHIEDDRFGENVIVQVFQKGFRLGDKVIRFAMVQVAN